MSRPAAEMSFAIVTRSLLSNDSSISNRLPIQPSVPQSTPPSSPPIEIRTLSIAHAPSTPPNTNCKGSAFEFLKHISEEEWQRRLMQKKAQEVLKKKQVLASSPVSDASPKGQATSKITRTIGFNA